VLFNACAPELWRRFTITLRRALARQAGLTNKELAVQVRVSFAKVANTSGAASSTSTPSSASTARPDRPLPHRPGPRWRCSPPPSTRPPAPSTWTPPAAAGQPAQNLAWGRELDARPITTTGKLTDAKLTAYVAKYATKAAECTGTLDRRLTPADQLDTLPVREHARRLIAGCLRLAKLPEFRNLRLDAWAHMLGFGGHFSTRSRAYSITFGSLRADRTQHQREQAIAAGLFPDLDSASTLVLAHWRFAGRQTAPSTVTGGAP
jgi:hypothetical protein